MSLNFPNSSSKDHVTGRSLFIDDFPPRRDELFVDVITSPIAYGTAEICNKDVLLKKDNVFDIIDADDLTCNLWGPIIQDTPFLAPKKVHYFGEPLALLVVRDRRCLPQLRQAVEIKTQEETPILTIDDAINQNSFFEDYQKISKGNAIDALNQAETIIEGTLEMKGQEHFYFETQAAIVTPHEHEFFKILSSSQHPTEVQHVCADILGLQYHQIHSEVLRMGGAFGGKESQASHIAALAAFVTQRTNRPCRIVLEREQDMQITGKRHGYKINYQAGFDQNGRIIALTAQLFADGGAYLDLSTAIMQRSLFHLDNVYYIENFHAEGRICRTHTAPNTAFRGFGGPQGMAVIENIMEEYAHLKKQDAYTIRSQNLYQKDRLETPYGQVLENNLIPDLFAKLGDKCHYQKRKLKVEEHNQKQLDTLKGIAITGSKFGISFTTRFLNQGNALVNIQKDGTVQVSTGATEMGQGVNTKIQGLVAETLQLPHDKVRVLATSTDKNANTSATAASSGSDINGAAAVNAALKILDRMKNIVLQQLESDVPLDPLDEYQYQPALDLSQVQFIDNAFTHSGNKRSISFVEAVHLCYYNRVSLSDYAHYKFPYIGFNKTTGKGKPFLYYTQGAACSEVSIDRFTGECKVLRTDILMDLGRPINELVDYGQITGAFIQGMGWLTSEDIVHSPSGELWTQSPTTYKIPNIQDVPRTFNINLIENNDNTINVRGSKAVGEPPFPLALSVWCAIKFALGSQTNAQPPQLKIPATAEAILFANGQDGPL